jgi:hypothetical protein
VVSKEDRERIEYQEMIRERDRSNRESAQALARIEAEENNLLSNPDVQAGLRDIKKKQWARGCFCYNGGMYGDSRLLAGSSGFGPAWRVDGGKIVSLTA